mgnify:CR=1 FL=1
MLSLAFIHTHTRTMYNYNDGHTYLRIFLASITSVFHILLSIVMFWVTMSFSRSENLGLSTEVVFCPVVFCLPDFQSKLVVVILYFVKYVQIICILCSCSLQPVRCCFHTLLSLDFLFYPLEDLLPGLGFIRCKSFSWYLVKLNVYKYNITRGITQVVQF